MISIIINIYNGEKFIEKCLESVINQTYRDLEILIINDGSTDKSLSICESYKDDRIRIVTTENLGLSMSRNVGIDNAKGDYLYFLDVDDFIELDTIEYLYNLIEKYDASIATCGSFDIYDYNCMVKDKKEKIELLSNREMLKKVLLFQDRAVAMWNKLIKKDLFVGLRLEDRIINDMAYTYKLFLRANTIVFSTKIKHYYFRHSDSITGKKANIDRIRDQYEVLIERYYYLKKIYPDLIENNICILQNIIKLFLLKEDEVRLFLIDNNYLDTYRELFSFRVIWGKIGVREKIKIILFRINPKLCERFVKLYLKIKW